MKLMVPLFVSVAVGVMSMTASAQESYTYGDMAHGVTVTTTEAGLPRVIMEWMDANPNRIPEIAANIQLAGDGIMCDLLVTYHMLNLKENERFGLREVAQEAQMWCFLIAALGVQE